MSENGLCVRFDAVLPRFDDSSAMGVMGARRPLDVEVCRCIISGRDGSMAELSVNGLWVEVGVSDISVI